jgi:hypothetical protein
MTQDERWRIRYQEVKEFIELYHRNPSKHRIEEHDMLNWVKANRKVKNAGKMKVDRVEDFDIFFKMLVFFKRNVYLCRQIITL